jgi:ABC-type transport system involved in multi-copper enzyme maturation permease subunit
MTATPTVPVAAPASATGGLVDPGFGAAFAAEWLKLRTARSPRRNLVLGVVLGIAASVLLALVVGATFDDWPASERAAFDPVLYPLSGSLFTAILFAAIGVNVVASEYSTGMMRTTLTATPCRRRVLAAKMLAVFLATGVATLVSTAAMIGLCQPIFAASDLPTVGPRDADLWRTVLTLAVVGPLFPVLAVTVTCLLRGTVASISTVLALIFAPSIVGGLLPDWWQRNVISLLPGPASDSVTIGHLADSATYLHPAAAALVVAGWVVVFWTVADMALSRRDA